MEKICLNCGKIVVGRADKKFCDDQCRSTYNFDHNNENNNIVKKTNAILKKNRAILIELNPAGKITLPKSELTERGFNFDYFTSIYETAQNDCYFYCYEMGYLCISDRSVLLVIKDNYPKYQKLHDQHTSVLKASES